MLGIIKLGSLFSFNSFDKNESSNIVKASMTQKNVPVDYEWVLSFDKGINQDKLNEQAVYVLDAKGNHVLVTFKVKDEQTLVVKSPKEGYTQKASYDLYFDRDIYLDHTNDTNSPKKYRLHFTTKNNS